MSGLPPAPEQAVADSIARPGVTWRIHCERVLLAGWGRAILLQLAHPMVARGVAEHSAFTSEPWGRLRRLRRTLRSMLALTFGPEDEAVATASRINAIHDRVHGDRVHGDRVHGDRLHGRPDRPASGAPAGAGYSAHDPALLAWVHAALLDSFLLTYRLFVGPIEPPDADRYCAEASAIEPRLGIPAGRLPRTEAQLQDYLERMLASGAIEVTDTARSLSREILAPPVPGVLRPALWLAALPAVGLLPPVIRVAYGLPWDRRRDHALRVMAGAARWALPLTPPPLRYWAIARRAERGRRAR